MLYITILTQQTLVTLNGHNKKDFQSRIFFYNELDHVL